MGGAERKRRRWLRNSRCLASKVDDHVAVAVAVNVHDHVEDHVNVHGMSALT
jgi:hypothetical protein